MAGRDTLQPPTPLSGRERFGGCLRQPQLMLSFVEPRLAIHYFVLVLVCFAGALQIAAARYQLKNLALVPTRQQPWAGVLLGVVLITGVLVWFVAATPEMLCPGPAGFEIGLLFVTAALLALVICRLTVALLRK